MYIVVEKLIVYGWLMCGWLVVYVGVIIVNCNVG